MSNHKQILNDFDEAISKIIVRLTSELENVSKEKKPLLAEGNEDKLSNVLKIVMGAAKIKGGLKEPGTPLLSGKEKKMDGKIVRPHANN